MPYLAHAPGKLRFIPLWHEMHCHLITTECPVDLEIITFNNGGEGHNDKPSGLLEKQVPATVLGAEIRVWRNSLKIELMTEHLVKPGPPFVLMADSSDVFVLRSLVGLTTAFQSFGCEAVFNMEKLHWPVDVDSSFENGLGQGFLNAGLWIATRSFAVEFSQALLSELRRTYSESEQRVVKRVFPTFYPRAVIDYTSRLFQGLNRVKDEVSFVKLY
jgi:hypothetical protein